MSDDVEQAVGVGLGAPAETQLPGVQYGQLGERIGGGQEVML